MTSSSRPPNATFPATEVEGQKGVENKELRLLFAECDAAGPKRLMFALRALVAAVVSVNSLAPWPASAAGQTSSWISSWTASPQAPRRVIPASFSNRTIRQIVHLSIGAAGLGCVCRTSSAPSPDRKRQHSVCGPHTSDIVSASHHPLTFGGSKSVIIPPGAPS